MSKVTFIHTADLHLDSPFKGLKHLPEELFQRVQNSTFVSFERIVDHALRKKVDLFLISGDLYDEEDRSIRAQARLKKQFQRLCEAGIAVYIIHGNHDYLGNYWSHLEMPDNVKVFGADVEEFIHTTNGGSRVHLYGFSYDTRHVLERKAVDYPAVRNNGDIHIALLHGSEAGETSAHETYAPFTIKDLKEKNYHYWALGHIHVRQELSASPPIVYPGNIQGRHRKETGPKGCYTVTIDNEGSELEFIETQEILWEKTTISLKEETKLSQVFELCKSEMERFRKNGNTFLEIEITDTEGLGADVLEKIKTGEILEAFQDGEEHQDAFVWVHSLRIKENTGIAYIEGQETFLNEMIHNIQGWDEQSWDEASSALFLHPQAHRYIDSLQPEEKEEIKEAVLSMLQNSFSHQES
ncbi:DNA repair exonuclease [Rossellomorea vietnamensis]|uniref:DNA repair exonuclease n=1 Tax=Rossellomorea vietnamensis TaxID=218284 RepID=A0A5D4MEU1_9BACI|nr:MULTISPECIES: DNA repair exonuclease [Bacillaceae]TYR99535.1 DNA repair exonuclease [Rossellomorea vietnamensis]